MIYLDTSLLVSLYCPDIYSTRAASLVQTAKEPFLITALCEVEAVNEIAQRVFRKQISQRQADASIQNLAGDLHAQVFQFAGLPEAAFVRARALSRQLTPKLGTRTADLLHVAAALELGATGFYTFDLNQRKAAQSAGLKTNPLP